MVNKLFIFKKIFKINFLFKGINYFLKEWFFKKNFYYILKRKLDGIDIKNNRLNLEVNKATEEDLKRLLENLDGLIFKEKKEIIQRIIFYNNGFKNCFVFKNKKGEIIHIQWLIFSYENEIISKKYKNKFPLLEKKQVMLENAYTFPNYRGLGILKSATYDLMNIAKRENYKTVIGYIRFDNIKSLNEFMEMGFKITGIIIEYKILGRVKRIFNKKYH